MPHAAQINRRRPFEKPTYQYCRACFGPFPYSSANKSEKLYPFMGRADKKTSSNHKQHRLSAQKTLVSRWAKYYRWQRSFMGFDRAPSCGKMRRFETRIRRRDYEWRYYRTSRVSQRMFQNAKNVFFVNPLFSRG